MSQIQPPPVTDMDDLPPHLQSIGAGIDFTDPNSPLAPYYLRTSDVVAVAFLAAVFFLLNLVPLWHTDVWGHLANGRWIAANRRLPDRDVLSPFADPEAKSLHVYWLCQTGFYLVYHAGEWLAGGVAAQQTAGGVELLRALHALLVTGRCLLLLFALRRLGCPPGLACFGLFVALALSLGHVAVLRPQVAGEFFMACVLLAVSRPVLSRRALILLPVVLVLWANSHGSFVLGLAVLAGCLAGEIIRSAVSRRSWRLKPLFAEPQIRRLSLALVASAVAVAAFNPHGPFIYPITWEMSRNPNVVAMDEWKPIFSTHLYAPVVIYVTSILIVLGAQLVSRVRYSPAQLVLMVGIGLQPIFHQRMMVWWLMLVPWLALPLLTTALERLPHYWRPEPAVPSFRKTVVAGLIAVVLVLWSAPGQWLVSGKPAPLAQVVSQGTPLELAHNLQDPEHPEGDWRMAFYKTLEGYPRHEYRGVIFASETQGDFLAWSLPHNTMPVFIDTHVHLFPAEQWQRAVLVKWALPGWREVLDNWVVNLVVVEADSHPHLCEALRHDDEWKVLLDETNGGKRDPRCRLFVALRKTPHLRK
jgi:hypothetical protein